MMRISKMKMIIFPSMTKDKGKEIAKEIPKIWSGWSMSKHIVKEIIDLSKGIIPPIFRPFLIKEDTTLISISKDKR